MNTAVLTPPATTGERSDGVWHSAWLRFKRDRVGMVSALIVIAFLLLIVFAALGLVAKNWQKEVGVANAPPGFLGPRPAEAIAMSALPDSVSQAAPAEHCRLTRNEIRPAASLAERVLAV